MGRWGPHSAATALTSDEARAGRSEADWAVFRDPEAAIRLTVEALAAAEPGRKRILAAAFDRSYAAYNRRDWEFNTLFVDRDRYEFEAGDIAGHIPGLPRVERGIDGYLHAQRTFVDGWQDLAIEMLEFRQIAPDRIFTVLRWTGAGARSGVPLTQRMAGVHDFAEGLVVGQTYWWNEGDGRRALGLQPSAPDRR